MKSFRLNLLSLVFMPLGLSNLTRAETPHSICIKPADTQAFVESKKNFKQRLEHFSNQPLVAKEADQTLSKLIAAKSPAIIQWMNQRDFSKKSDTEVAHEWRVYYAEEFTLSRYPIQQQPQLNRQIESFVETTYASALPMSTQKKLLAIFSEAKKQALATVKRFQLSTADQTMIENRVSSIELNFLKKLKGSAFERKPLEAVSWGIAYDPAPNRINIGTDVLQYSTDENLYAAFAHEIGHSFDPCRWVAFLKSQNPFSSVVACLRGPLSAGAKPRDDSKLSELEKSNPEVYRSLKANPTCNQALYPNAGLQADQISEAFADWFSAEVISKSKYSKSKIRTDLCESTPLEAGSSYPPNEVRLSHIYFAQPLLRAQVKKDLPEAAYCASPNFH